MEYLDSFYVGLLNILPFSAQGQSSFLFMLIGIAIGFVVGTYLGWGDYYRCLRHHVGFSWKTAGAAIRRFSQNSPGLPPLAFRRYGGCRPP